MRSNTRQFPDNVKIISSGWCRGRSGPQCSGEIGGGHRIPVVGDRLRTRGRQDYCPVRSAIAGSGTAKLEEDWNRSKIGRVRQIGLVDGDAALRDPALLQID